MPNDLEAIAFALLLEAPAERVEVGLAITKIPHDQLLTPDCELLLFCLVVSGNATVHYPVFNRPNGRVDVWMAPNGPRMPVADWCRAVLAWRDGTGPRPAFVPASVDR